MKAWLVPLILIFAVFAGPSFAETKAPVPARKPAGSAATSGRSTIEFDEKVVEGMGQKDLSSARHTGENRGRKGQRLIREKTDFHDELKRSLREVPWVQ
jgi:hypothetical protein